MNIKRIIESIKVTCKLLNSKKYYFKELKPSSLEEIPAVYTIFDKDTKRTLYVGRTKNLQTRLYTNHLMGDISNARLKKYLIEDPNIYEVTTTDEAKQYLKEHCYFQYIPEDDTQRRGQIEGLLGYMLNVSYIHEEH